MNNLPLVSVIIPNYNHEAFLGERIEAVLSQTFQSFEIIILDDCSTDNSKSVIEKYRGHEKVQHIHYNSQNSGSTFKQWKKGLELAKGKWIWIAESDDRTSPLFLSTLLDGVAKGSDIVLAYSASHKIDAEGHVFGVVDWAETVSDRNWHTDFYNTGTEEIKHQLFYKNTIPNASAVLFKKSAVDWNVFDQISTMRFAGDWFFWVRLLEKGNLFFTGQFLNQFREHGNTTRTMKPVEVEISRFGEYFKVLNYVQKKYRMHWNYKKHIWIIDEWVDKYFRFPTFTVGNNVFPRHYNVIAQLKISKNKMFGPLKRASIK